MKYENTKKLYLVFFISNNIWIIFTNIIVDAIIYDILKKVVVNMENDLKEIRISEIIKIIRQNRNLSTNDIKRKVKEAIPHINGEQLHDILINYSDIINYREEESER